MTANDELTAGRRLALALVHYPVLGRQGEVLTTTITNLDLHDLSRSARVYGLERFYVVHPILSQRTLAQRIQDHWVNGAGRRRIPDRATALELLRIVPTLDSVCRDLCPSEGRTGVELWTTAARDVGESFTFDRAREQIQDTGRPVVICFGTGWGLSPRVIEEADRHLEPICARADTGYNHLSVRAACAITLDRLLG